MRIRALKKKPGPCVLSLHKRRWINECQERGCHIAELVMLDLPNRRDVEAKHMRYNLDRINK